MTKNAKVKKETEKPNLECKLKKVKMLKRKKIS